MDPVTKIFTFVSGKEDLAEISPFADHLSWNYEPTIGDPAAGSLLMHFDLPDNGCIGGLGKLSEFQVAVQGGEQGYTKTWADWGVPAGYAVTGIALESFRAYPMGIILTAIQRPYPEQPTSPTFVENVEFDVVNSGGSRVASTATSGLYFSNIRAPLKPPDLPAKYAWNTVSVGTVYPVSAAATGRDTIVKLKVAYSFVLTDGYLYGLNEAQQHVDPNIWIDTITLKLYLVGTEAGSGDEEEPPPPEEEDPPPPPSDEPPLSLPPDDPEPPDLPGGEIKPPPQTRTSTKDGLTPGTYAFDIEHVHPYIGTRSSEKFVRVIKSATTDSHMIDMATKNIKGSLQLNTAINVMNYATRTAQHLLKQFLWRTGYGKILRKYDRER